MTLAKAFWSGKRVLITGHSGFKGGWLALWLQRLGAKVTGIALPPSTIPNLFDLAEVSSGIDSYFCDVRNLNEFAKIIVQSDPEIVFHLAAQPLVRASYRDPIGTYATNIMGTANLLESLRDLNNVKVAVMITTDKVYANKEWYFPYRETDMLGGYDPYSASKAASEIVIASYRSAFLLEKNIAIASARAGNVIGGGDWSEDRLIPDAVRSWQSGAALEIRHPEAVRPWQHVLEPLHGYIKLAEKLWYQPNCAGPYNFGPSPDATATVKDVISRARLAFGTGAVKFGDSSGGPHEAGLLALETSKVRQVIGIVPKWDLAESIDRTMCWYKALQDGTNARKLCEKEITAFEKIK